MVYKIAVIGQQCSGKTTAAKFFQKHFDHSVVVKIADPIYDTLRALRKEKHRAFMQQFADLAKKHFGEEILAEIFQKRVLEIQDKYLDRDLDGQHPTVGGKDILLVCDDIRFPYELKIVRGLGFKLVAINANTEVRKARAKRLGLDFIENHNSETLVPSLFPSADHVVYDDGISMEDLGKHCDIILKTIENEIISSNRVVS